MPALTKLWFVQVKPEITIFSDSFGSIWTSLVSFCNSQTSKPTHTLWLVINDPTAQSLVFITGYPDQETTDKADEIYLQDYMPTIMQLVTHKRILQVPIDYERIVKGKEGYVVMEVGSKREMENDQETLKTRDVWESVLREKKGEEAGEAGVEISFSYFEDEVSLRREDVKRDDKETSQRFELKCIIGW